MSTTVDQRRPKSFSDVMSALEADGCHFRKQGAGYVCECHLPGCGHKTPQGHLGLEDGGDKTLVSHFPSLDQEQFYKDFCAYYKFDSLNYSSNGHGPHKAAAKTYGELDCTYPYQEVDRRLLFEVVRYKNPKGFAQRRPDPDKPGEWIWGLAGIKPIIYHLPEVKAANARGEIIYFAEGEKDADNIIRMFNLIASTSPMGAGKWRDHYTECLKGAKEVRICSDNDEPGRKHAAQVAGACYAAGIPVKVLNMPKPDIKDVSDWINAGCTVQEFLNAFAALPPWEPPKPLAPAVPIPNRPEIIKTGRSMLEWVMDARAAITKANDPPQLFVRSGHPSRVTEDEEGRPVIAELSFAALKGFIERSCQFVKLNQDGDSTPIPPPEDVTADILEYGPWDWPPLVGISETPTIRPDGSIHDQPGYDPKAKLYYKPARGLKVPVIPGNPSSADVKAAKELLLLPFAEFPFVDDASRAHAIATLLSAILLPMINGCCPMPIIDKPQAGTGATLCAKVISIVTTGNITGMTAWTNDGEALKKQITSLLMMGRSVVIFDNIEGKVYDPSLAAVLTTTVWEDRILGRSEIVVLPNRAIWIGTGNNISLGGDLPRRCIWIRMDAKRAQPWTGKIYKINNLEGWALEHRGEMIAAALTLARAWIQAGSPPCRKTLGSFERWIAIVGGIIEWVDIPGFLDNLQDMYETADKDSPQTEAFLEQWHATIPGPVTAQRVKEVLDARDNIGAYIYREFRDAIPDFLGDYLKSDNFTRKLGNWLAKIKDVYYTGGLHLKTAGESHKVLLWKVEKSCGLDTPQEKTGEIGGFRGSRGSKSPQRAEILENGENIKIRNSGVETDPPNPQDPPELPGLSEKGITDFEDRGTSSPQELPNCPKCGKWAWTYDPEGHPVCSCGCFLDERE